MVYAVDFKEIVDEAWALYSRRLGEWQFWHNQLEVRYGGKFVANVKRQEADILEVLFLDYPKHYTNEALAVRIGELFERDYNAGSLRSSIGRIRKFTGKLIPLDRQGGYYLNPEAVPCGN